MSFWAAGASIVGGVMASSAAGDAADTQAASSAAAIAEQRRQYDTTRGDYAQYRGVGSSALARLASLMGLDVPGYGASGGATPTRDTLRQQLLPRFTTGSAGAAPQTDAEWRAAQYQPGGSQSDTWGGSNPYGPQSQAAGSSIDETGLNAEIDRVLAAQPSGRSADFGTAMDNNNVENEAGYQFGMRQGQMGVDRKTAAAGGRVSGAALKAASQFNTDYASSMYGAADQRRENRLNRLAALAGIGQSATGSTAMAGQNAGNNISNLTSGQGNAAGAAQIAQGNIWGGAANQLGAIGQKWASQPRTGWNSTSDSQGLNVALG